MHMQNILAGKNLIMCYLVSKIGGVGAVVWFLGSGGPLPHSVGGPTHPYSSWKIRLLCFAQHHTWSKLLVYFHVMSVGGIKLLQPKGTKLELKIPICPNNMTLLFMIFYIHKPDVSWHLRSTFFKWIFREASVAVLVFCPNFRVHCASIVPLHA